MPIINLEDWKEQEEKNKDEYGKCVIDRAREVMKLLDLKEYEDFDCHKLLCDADKNIKDGGITGFQEGCIAQIISHCHSRGEEFRKKWNKDYGVGEEKETYNPYR